MHDRSTKLYLFCDKKQTQVSDINSSEKWPWFLVRTIYP
jgi:hypothetical protein